MKISTEVWVTSDTHFGHRRIALVREFDSVEAMDEALIEKWNRVVGRKDTVFHLGDFSFGKRDEILNVLQRLNGRIQLVPGNHDSMIRRHPERYLGVDRFEAILPAGDHKVAPKTKMFLSHYPHEVWSSSHHGRIHLHGHSHGTSRPWGRRLDVGIDCNEITPVLRPVWMDEINEYMRGRVTPAADYHRSTQGEGLWNQ